MFENNVAEATAAASIRDYFRARALRVPDRFAAIFEGNLPVRLPGVLLLPGTNANRSLTFAWADSVIDGSEWPLLPNLVPLALVDEKSFACVVASSIDDEDPLPGEGRVVRWHLEAKEEHQAALLDTDCFAYVESLALELEAREKGLHRMLEEIGPAYELQYLEIGKRPRDFVHRPVRIACQNVVVALGAFAHDSSFDGLSVIAWQTCEVPHVNAHEANRSLTALMLCDAFQSGGTMEIRFDHPARLKADGVTPKSGQKVQLDERYAGHPEGAIPASLRRFARTVGVQLGQGPDATRISPAESRELFRAITPMPEQLADRIEDAAAAGVGSPERFYFTLLSQVWREIELDFLLSVSPRTGSIISGGAPFTRRAARQAESEVARAALMIGMLLRRLDTKDGAGAEGSEARVLEDNRVGVSWEVLPDEGAVRFLGLGPGDLPWVDKVGPAEIPPPPNGSIVVLPRLMIDSEVLDAAAKLTDRNLGRVAIVVPHDAPALARHAANSDCLLLRCPERLAELDQTIEAKLLQARISRA